MLESFAIAEYSNMKNFSHSLVLGFSIRALTSASLSFGADEMTPANRAIEDAKAKTRASGSPYGAQTSPNTRLTYPSAMVLELLGRGLLWSASFDQAMNEDMSVGVGIGSVNTVLSGSTISAHQQAWMVPVYVNYYFAPSARSIFATGGINIVTNNRDVQNQDAETSNVEFGFNSVIPTLGVGFESRGDNGFLFRGTAYGLYSDHQIFPWFGFSFGYAF